MKNLKTISLFLLILLLGASCNSGKGLAGTWYTQNHSGFIEITLTNDSILRRTMLLDFTPKPRREESTPYLKCVALKDRTLVITKARKDPEKYVAMVFFTNSNGIMQATWNVPDTGTNTMDEIIELNKKEHGKLYGFNCYTRGQIDSLQKLKPVQSMSLTDFRRWVVRYTNKIKETKAETDKHLTGYMAAWVDSWQLMTQSLLETGYNPFIYAEDMDSVGKKYDSDPEVKQLFEQAGRN